MTVTEAPISTQIGPERRRWTLNEYIHLDEIGLLSKDGEKYELLDGEIFRKLGQNLRHVAGIRLATIALSMVFGKGFVVDQQVPLHLGEFDAPEPDITVLRGNARDFENRWPVSKEVVLLVEVVDTRLDTALVPKASIYARHGILEYWILNVRNRTLEVRKGPRSDGNWTETRVYAETESVSFGPESHGISSETRVSIIDLLPVSADGP